MWDGSNPSTAICMLSAQSTIKKDKIKEKQGSNLSQIREKRKFDDRPHHSLRKTIFYYFKMYSQTSIYVLLSLRTFDLRTICF
jgi:hypothetical protein